MHTTIIDIKRPSACRPIFDTTRKPTEEGKSSDGGIIHYEANGVGLFTMPLGLLLKRTEYAVIAFIGLQVRSIHYYLCQKCIQELSPVEQKMKNCQQSLMPLSAYPRWVVAIPTSCDKR